MVGTVKDNATIFVVSRPLKNETDKITLLEKNKTYKFIYALNTAKNSGQHDVAGSYIMNIDTAGTVTFAENANKMYASAAAIVSMAAMSYLI